MSPLNNYSNLNSLLVKTLLNKKTGVRVSSLDLNFYVPNIEFYNKIAPFLKEKHFSLEGGVSPLIRPINTEPFYLYVYKDFEEVSKSTYEIFSFWN